MTRQVPLQTFCTDLSFESDDSNDGFRNNLIPPINPLISISTTSFINLGTNPATPAKILPTLTTAPTTKVLIVMAANSSSRRTALIQQRQRVERHDDWVDISNWPQDDEVGLVVEWGSKLIHNEKKRKLRHDNMLRCLRRKKKGIQINNKNCETRERKKQCS